MAFPNTSLTDLVITTMENRSSKIADNVTNNNGLLRRLKKKGKLKLVDGGRTIYRAFSFQKNSNGGFYSGYDVLPTGAADVISGAEYSWKQYAVPVAMSGLEELQNSGEEQLFDLLASRIDVAESTMDNDISIGIYTDGTLYYTCAAKLPEPGVYGWKPVAGTEWFTTKHGITIYGSTG